MGREVKSGNTKITVVCSESLRADFNKVCGYVKNGSMSQAIRDFMQDQVKKFKKDIPAEPEQ